MKKTMKKIAKVGKASAKKGTHYGMKMTAKLEKEKTKRAKKKKKVLWKPSSPSQLDRIENLLKEILKEVKKPKPFGPIRVTND